MRSACKAASSRCRYHGAHRRTPIGRGELSVADGRYEALGQKLDINRGRLLFDASPLDDPGLDIEARRRVETTEVGLNVRGTLQAPRLTFFSDPR
jgi:translocation and assembly module TamB